MLQEQALRKVKREVVFAHLKLIVRRLFVTFILLSPDAIGIEGGKGNADGPQRFPYFGNSQKGSAVMPDLNKMLSFLPLSDEDQRRLSSRLFQDPIGVFKRDGGDEKDLPAFLAAVYAKAKAVGVKMPRFDCPAAIPSGWWIVTEDGRIIPTVGCVWKRTEFWATNLRVLSEPIPLLRSDCGITWWPGVGLTPAEATRSVLDASISTLCEWVRNERMGPNEAIRRKRV